MRHRAWQFYDPITKERYTPPINPNQMTPPFLRRQIQSKTTLWDGQPMLIESQAPPVEWSFGGDILTQEHYEALRKWVQGKKGQVWIYDHFGRQLRVYFVQFKPTGKRSLGKYWRHTYEVDCILLADPTPPSVGEVPIHA